MPNHHLIPEALTQDRITFDAETGEPMLRDVDIYRHGSNTEEVLFDSRDWAASRAITKRWRTEEPHAETDA